MTSCACFVDDYFANNRMATKNRAGGLLRIALIEPNEADVRWFEMLIDEALVPIVIVRYATGVAALESWAELDAEAGFDLILMPDILPMLTAEEFVTAARSRLPRVPILAACGNFHSKTLSPLPAGVQLLTKPLSHQDVNTLQRYHAAEQQSA